MPRRADIALRNFGPMSGAMRAAKRDSDPAAAYGARTNRCMVRVPVIRSTWWRTFVLCDCCVECGSHLGERHCTFDQLSADEKARRRSDSCCGRAISICEDERKHFV